MRELGNPTTCPHGNPIPGSGYEAPPGTRALSEIEPGGPFTVTRIREELEFEPGQLEFLEASGLMPGRTGTVVSVAADGERQLAVGHHDRGDRRQSDRREQRYGGAHRCHSLTSRRCQTRTRCD